MNNEISLLKLINDLWRGRKLFLIFIPIFIFFSIILAQTTPKLWVAENSVFLRSENSGGFDGAVGGLASLAGVKLSNQSNGQLNPEAYEHILSTNYFISEIVYSQVYYRAVGDSITVYEFFDLHQESSLISRIRGGVNSVVNSTISIFKGQNSGVSSEQNDWVSDDFLMLNNNEKSVFSDVKSSIIIDYNPKKSILTIGFKSQDGYLSAQVTDIIISELREFVNEFHMIDLQRKYDFAKRQYLEKEKNYNEAQVALAEFRDKNIALNTNSAKIEDQRLQQEYDLAYNFFSEIALTIQSIEVDLQGRKPVFEVVGKTLVPGPYSYPNKKMFVLIGAFFGLIFCSILILASIDIKKSLTRALDPVIKIVRK